MLFKNEAEIKIKNPLYLVRFIESYLLHRVLICLL
jgi:hypothetical protein